MTVKCSACKMKMFRVEKRQEAGTGVTVTKHCCTSCHSEVEVFRAGQRTESPADEFVDPRDEESPGL